LSKNQSSNSAIPSIERVAVIGSGVMGAGIAAHCANAGCEVLLLDILPKAKADSKDQSARDSIAAEAITKMAKSNPEMLMHKSYAKRITAGNIEDHLSLLKDYDWVVEVIIENLGIKRSLYEKLDKYVGPETIVSSNTSTLPRSVLTEQMSDKLSSRFLITHFFNPPRYLPLLELVSGPEVDQSVVSRIVEFADIRLG